MLCNKTISATKKLHTTTSITFLTHRGLHKTLPTPFAYTKEHILYHDRDNDGESFHLPRPIIVLFDPKMLFADYDHQRTYQWPTSCYPMKTHNPKHISSHSQQRKNTYFMSIKCIFQFIGIDIPNLDCFVCWGWA